MISIGISDDIPGMGWEHNGQYTGFEVDIARGVANILGYGDGQIVFKTVTPSTRTHMLADGNVDIVVANVAMSENNLGKMALAGPYLNTQQELLVRNDAHHAITSLQDIAHKSVCVPQGSISGRRLQEKIPSVRLNERSNYQQCVAALLVGQTDAVAGVAPIVHGLEYQAGKEYVTVVEEPFAQESLAIAVRPDQQALVAKIDDALQTMMRQGTWQHAAHVLEEQSHFQLDGAMNPPRISVSKE